MKVFLHRFVHSNTQAKEANVHTLKWAIADFEWLLKNQTNREILIDAVNYPEDTSEDAKFQVKIKLVGNQNDLIEIYYLAPALVFVKSILTMWSKASGSYGIECTQEYHWVKKNKWQLLAVQFKQHVINEKILNDGSLYLKIDFCVKNRTMDLGNTMPGPQLEELVRPKSLLVNDLENLFENPILSDVTVKSVEGVEFEAHKVILITRSIVLKAHFEHNTVESLTNVVESPLEAEVLQEMLSYIYTDKVPKIDNIPEKLLMAADFYQLSGLKKLCEKALQKKLNVENAIEILELASLHSATDLKRQTLEFINYGRAREIITTKGWEKLTSTALIKSLYEHKIVTS